MTRQRVPDTGITPSAVTIVVACVVTFLAQKYAGIAMLRVFALWPMSFERIGTGKFELWQLLTYGFLHVSWPHLIFNMLALVTIGCVLETLWGSMRFVVFYLVCVVVAGIVQTVFTGLGFSGSLVVGASGGVFGLLMGYALKFPREMILPLIPPVPMWASALVVIYGLAAIVLGFTGKGPYIAHFAHLGGMLGGFALIWLAPRYFPVR